MSPPDRLVVGTMTGTSIDAIDVALVRVVGHGLSMHARFVAGHSAPLGPLAAELRAFAEQTPTTAGAIADLSRRFALLHAEVIESMLAEHHIAAIDLALIGVHGQTVFHAPPTSWQLFSPAVLAQRLGVMVISDLRAADLAAGGQGAPITPLADWICLRGPQATAVVNLGGFCNITLLPAHTPAADNTTLSGLTGVSGVSGADLCACNHLLDEIARRVLNTPYDHNGQAALSGQAHPATVAELDALLQRQSRLGRSLGTGDELAAVIARLAQRTSPQDLCASACHALGQRIGAACHAHPRVLLAGGGTRNAALVAAISASCHGDVCTTDHAGLPAAYREAVHMGVLAALCADKVPITLPAVTGVGKAPLSGTFTPAP